MSAIQLKIQTNKKYLLLIICIYGFLFENCLEINVSKAFGFFDEVIALFFLFIIIRGEG